MVICIGQVIQIECGSTNSPCRSRRDLLLWPCGSPLGGSLQRRRANDDVERNTPSVGSMIVIPCRPCTQRTANAD
jgi:hypothetical protein